MSGWSRSKIGTEMEIEEESFAISESIKSEEERNVGSKPATLPQKYEVHRIGASLQCSEVTWRSNDDVSLSSRCRLCAIPYNDMIDIFSSLEVEDILEKIKYSLPIMVTEMDTLPKQICCFCLEELERCYRFHKIVAEADKQLHAFDKLASMKSEKMDKSIDSSPTYNAQRGSTEYDNIDGPLETVSEIETNNNKLTIIPEDAQTAYTTVKSNVLLKSLLRPCSVVLSIIESCCKNSSDVENGRESPSNTEHRNLVSTSVSTPETIDSGSTAVSEVNQQSARHSEKHLMNSVTHAPAHISEQRYKCNKCVKMFKWKSHLTKHSSVHMDERRHKCNTCAKTFKQKSNLTQHSKIHTNKGFYSCEYCGKKFTSRGNRECHVRIHTNERPFKCPTCDRSFIDPSGLKQHLAIHSEERNHICRLCDKSFKSLKSRNAHMLVHASNTQRVQCDYCKKHYSKKWSLHRHLRICKERVEKTTKHVRIAPDNVPCCPKVY